MFLHHIDSTNQSAPTHASNDQADGYATKKKKIGISTWRHKNMRKQRCFEDIEIKNLSGISQQRKKKAAIGHVALDGYVLASETYP